MKQNIKGKHKVWLYVEFKKEITFSFHFKPSVTRSKIMKENWEELHYDSLWIGRIEVQTSEVAQGCFYEEKELATQLKIQSTQNYKCLPKTPQALSGWHQ